MNNRGASSLLHSKVKLARMLLSLQDPRALRCGRHRCLHARGNFELFTRARRFCRRFPRRSTLRPDNEANHKLYGESTDAQKIIDGQARAVPPAALIWSPH